ncbi:glucose-inhibited division protein A [Polaribacter irgensii 23-P]|jgi:tRNA uridine 5-carboxymethylaminomethyl modification enzyme|uniref:tRNA uridine 5-carboxymethylaminomethyl modification enzyme MnmG n=1 Tax=Polaribacter irgensii 23-P TaxID=313594 RepID=A4BXD2_9FLAO|nr:tRNA uridine-5-carboxymethylaminomethyl(34) synthesis enzyme MnmG [Polaribacter irgensii]EAR13623.1 glucose-inhibited division protein A [Polaribacter irgensii 23-P]
MSLFSTLFDVIVVGGGHAGSEAAAASANMGAHTLLITTNLQNIAQMSCNPAMGGIAKGQIVREIDALGGYSGIVTDKTAIQFKMLNKSKGPAMWSPRVQSDRMQFSECWRTMLEQTEKLDFYQDSVNELLFDGNKIIGVKTALGLEIKAKTVIITAGTFLNGLIHIGEKSFGGGRAGEGASTGITEALVKKGFESGRMKTGTPPRVDSRSLDFSKMIEQPGDEITEKFSHLPSTKALTEQRSCYLTYTNPKVHELLREGFDRSPMFNGRIKSTGPRYCPSVEDKIDRFATKDRHQIFVEPEGWTTVEMYVNGFSTSLPEDIQDKAIRAIEGFENVKFLRYGYAIEYDFFQPTQLKHSLETKLIENLFFAGQINGTTGYEEAAAQGLMAGVNAALKTQGKAPFILKRNEAYIGVLIDDLITKGTEEPYRMFTSRAEYRTLLRQDNADLRLTPLGYKLGLASQERMDRMLEKQKKTALLIQFLNETSVKQEEVNPILSAKGLALVNQSMKLFKVAARPQLSLSDFMHLTKLKDFLHEHVIQADAIEQAQIHLKYSGYIDKEKNNADKLNRLENVVIPSSFIYEKVKSLSFEATEKLNKVKPTSISQASRISGVSPSDISVLLVYMGR